MKYQQEFLEKVRMYFLENEGYMEYDDVCIGFWDAMHPEDSSENYVIKEINER